MSLANMILYHCIHTLLDFPRLPTTDSHLNYKKYGVRIFWWPLGNPPPVTKQWQSQQEDAPVTVDMHVLIDKVLSCYSGKFTVFCKLLQNSDDAGCDTAKIHFETARFLGSNSKAAMNFMLTFSACGFGLRSIHHSASGNPDPQKVGTFGINLWMTLKMPPWEAAPMPPILQFMQFLSSSITFMIHLKNVTVFFDHHHVGQIHKSLGQSQVIPIPTELKWQSPVGNMTMDSVQQYGKSSQHLRFASITIEASVMPPQCDSMRMHGMKVELIVFAVEVDVTVSEKLSKELKWCMKKYPPSCLKYSLIYIHFMRPGKMKYDQSCINKQKHAPEFPFAVLGALRRSGWGHATAQTTDIVGHMASCFIPTVEHECIDFVNRNVTTWNRELLYVRGFLCRVVYELELSDVQRLWKEAAADMPQSPKLHDHLSFHTVLSSVGICEAPGIRVFDQDLAEFLKSFPILSEDVMQMNFIEKLPD
ncbi:hypothetical protein EDC04DRAFT_2608171 [Pisolithus marmoratus]|nr:hypothetical protein EDC04DRAFT_2608171 [Pisolithus marmoratus]